MKWIDDCPLILLIHMHMHNTYELYQYVSSIACNRCVCVGIRKYTTLGYVCVYVCVWLSGVHARLLACALRIQITEYKIILYYMMMNMLRRFCGTCNARDCNWIDYYRFVTIVFFSARHSIVPGLHLRIWCFITNLLIICFTSAYLFICEYIIIYYTLLLFIMDFFSTIFLIFCSLNSHFFTYRCSVRRDGTPFAMCSSPDDDDIGGCFASP